ncbi:MAG: polyprenyl synthetase family protein [Candidatus Aenigmarchaeota archaeon]|nr:polyprenyl synthetase family protein [Candidatus Aenigmarchaeota archaeon]
MDIMFLLEKEKLKIDAVMEKYFPRIYSKNSLEKIAGKSEYDYDVAAVNKSIADPIWNLLDRGGKRWRPFMFLVILEALEADVKKNYDFCVIPEIIHNGTLLIDDIEDKGETRRGKPCVHKIFGDDIAINAGNMMYFMPLYLFKNSNLNEKIKTRLYEIYIQEMINISFGQGMDIAWHKGLSESVSVKQYLQMCAYKTGTLARMSAKLAAIIAEADAKTTEKVGLFAESLGIAFQIQDDILDVVSKNRKSFGKVYGNDIIEGKRSLMVVHTLNKANREDKKQLILILNAEKKTKEQIESAIKLLKKYNSIEFAKKKSREILSKAWSRLDPALNNNNGKSKLKALGDFLIEREI